MRDGAWWGLGAMEHAVYIDKTYNRCVARLPADPDHILNHKMNMKKKRLNKHQLNLNNTPVPLFPNTTFLTYGGWGVSPSLLVLHQS